MGLEPTPWAVLTQRASLTTKPLRLISTVVHNGRSRDPLQDNRDDLWYVYLVDITTCAFRSRGDEFYSGSALKSSRYALV